MFHKVKWLTIDRVCLLSIYQISNFIKLISETKTTTDNDKFLLNCSRNDAEEDQVVGWPPVKSWRKKIFHQHQVGRIENNLTVEKENGRSIYVKVKMEGVAIARKIDIRLFHSYQALTNSLISMFAKRKLYTINPSKISRNKQVIGKYPKSQHLGDAFFLLWTDQKCDEDDYTRYTLTYQDKEGDWLIAGDIPWQ